MSRIAKHVTLRSHYRRKWTCQLTIIFVFEKHHMTLSNVKWKYFQIYRLHTRLLNLSLCNLINIHSISFLFYHIPWKLGWPATCHWWMCTTRIQSSMICTSPPHDLIPIHQSWSPASLSNISTILTSNILHRINRATLPVPISLLSAKASYHITIPAWKQWKEQNEDPGPGNCTRVHKNKIIDTPTTYTCSIRLQCLPSFTPLLLLHK